MANRFRKIFLFSAYIFLVASPIPCFAYYEDRDWDYHGSGRDHPYSQYIDRANYVGYADYTRFKLDYFDESLPPVSPLPTTLPANQPVEFIVNIPNRNGGYIAVVIKQSGNGYIGPKGEYYPEFPKIFQLELIYG